MKFQKQFLSVFAALFLLKGVHAKDTDEKEQPKSITLSPGPIIGNYNKNDFNEDYEDGIEIQCDDVTCQSSSDNVLLEEGKITIANAGTYILGGNLYGQLNIDATKDDLIHLVFKNITISSNFGPAVYAKKSKNVIITLEGQNTISDSIFYPENDTTDDTSKKDTVDTTDETTEIAIIDETTENTTTEETTKKDKDSDENDEKQPDACIYIKSNLTFNGKGSLDVNANYNDGILSKKNLKLISGKINVVSKGNAIKGKNSISIKDAEINIDAGKSGIKATKDTDPDKGFVVIDGGKMTIKVVKDGVHAETHLTINDGNIKILECEEGLEGQMIDITGGDIFINTSNDGINSSKIGAVNEAVHLNRDYSNDDQVYIRITGGKVDVRAEGSDLDGIDSNGSLLFGGTSQVFVDTVYGGAFGHMAAVDSDGAKIIDTNCTALITGSGRIPSSLKHSRMFKRLEESGNIGEATDPKTSEVTESLKTPKVTLKGFPRITFPKKTTTKTKTTKTKTTKTKTTKTKTTKTKTTKTKTTKTTKTKTTKTKTTKTKTTTKTSKTWGFGGGFGGSTYVYDEPDSVTCLQPYVRVVIDLQKEGTPISIKNSDGEVLIERAPRAQFAIVFFTSPEIILGETYTINVGKITKVVTATVDEKEKI